MLLNASAITNAMKACALALLWPLQTWNDTSLQPRRPVCSKDHIAGHVTECINTVGVFH